MEREIYWKTLIYSITLIIISIFVISILKISLLSAVILLLAAAFAATIYSSDLEHDINRLSEAIHDMSKGIFEPRVTRKAGTEFRRIEDAIYEVQHKLSSMRDALSGAQDKTNMILSSMIEGVIAVGGKGEIILINEAARKFLSINENAVGESVIEASRNQELNELIDKAVSGSDVSEAMIHILTPREIILLVQAGPTSGGGAVAVMQDITRLQKLESIRKEFVANVSHELKTPITAIRSSAETLLEGAINDPSHNRDFLDKINKNTERLSVLIDDILELSELDNRKTPDVIKPCRLQDVYDKAMEIETEYAKTRNVSISSSFYKDTVKIMCNEDHLLRVLLNLIDNAIKYNKDGGSVKVASTDEDDKVLIEVSDTGIGIEEKHFPRLFERFYTVDKARSRELGGTGLGLAIAKHIVELNGGDIWVSSKLGVGSTFSFTLKKA